MRLRRSAARIEGPGRRTRDARTNPGSGLPQSSIIPSPTAQYIDRQLDRPSLAWTAHGALAGENRYPRDGLDASCGPRGQSRRGEFVINQQCERHVETADEARVVDDRANSLLSLLATDAESELSPVIAPASFDGCHGHRHAMHGAVAVGTGRCGLKHSYAEVITAAT